jgi:hypothetical protein
VPDVRPGERYVLTFRPLAFEVGTGLGLAGLALLGALLGLELRARRRTPRPGG